MNRRLNRLVSRVMKIRHLLGFTCVVLVACSDDGGSSNGSGNASGTDLELDASEFFEGTHSIRGTITLPSSGAGRAVQLNVSGEGLRGNFLGPAGKTGAGSTATYTILGLPAGKYTVQARIDVTGNGMLGDQGDFDGTSQPIDVATSVTGVDFGVEIVP